MTGLPRKPDPGPVRTSRRCGMRPEETLGRGRPGAWTSNPAGRRGWGTCFFPARLRPRPPLTSSFVPLGTAAACGM